MMWHYLTGTSGSSSELLDVKVSSDGVSKFFEDVGLGLAIFAGVVELAVVDFLFFWMCGGHFDNQHQLQLYEVVVILKRLEMSALGVVLSKRCFSSM